MVVFAKAGGPRQLYGLAHTEGTMKLLLTVATAGVALASLATTPDKTAAPLIAAPAFQSIGALTFGPPGVLYAADPMAATIYALELPAPTGAKGTRAIDDVDVKIAAMLGTVKAEIGINDLVVDPRNGNSLIAVTRNTGTGGPQSAIVRVDGAGNITLVDQAAKVSSLVLPNPANANPAATRGNPRMSAVTDMAYQDGKLFVAGLSNEEFASKLYSFAYPFTTADRGTSVEIYHGNHGALETRSPVYTFVPYTVGGTKSLIAGYLCTPLVKFPVEQLTPGAKITGTTIAELGAGNRPIDMIVYNQGGKDYLLMSNTSRGVMKIPTANFASQEAITTRIGGTAGIGYETIASLTGVQQLDKLDATTAVVIVRTPTGGNNLQTVALP
jgi:hypothetical protein